MNTLIMPYLFFYLFLIIVVTRTLPYVFAERLKKAKMIECIGKQLPAYIMLLLLIYEIEIQTFFQPPYGLYEIIALMLLTVIHYWRRNMLLSLFISCASYLLFVNNFQ